MRIKANEKSIIMKLTLNPITNHTLLCRNALVYSTDTITSLSLKLSSLESPFCMGQECE